MTRKAIHFKFLQLLWYNSLINTKFNFKFLVEQVILTGFTTTRSQLNISVNELRSRLNLLSTVLSNCITVNDNEIKLDTQFDSMDPSIFSKLVKISILFHQHDNYVVSLTKSLLEAKAVIIDPSVKAFQDKLRHIHELVKFRTAIPTDKIFVRFVFFCEYVNQKINFLCLARVCTIGPTLASVARLNSTVVRNQHCE